MTATFALEDVSIRTDLQPGDLENVAVLHGQLYVEEFQFGQEFEQYVRKGLEEFRLQYDPEKDRIWVCEHNNNMIGFLSLMHRPNDTAQLRYFVLKSEYRGIGLGKKLMSLFMDFLREKNYQSAYLWTVSQLDSATSLYKKFGFILTEEKNSDAFGRNMIEQRYDFHRYTL